MQNYFLIGRLIPADVDDGETNYWVLESPDGTIRRLGYDLGYFIKSEVEGAASFPLDDRWTPELIGTTRAQLVSAGVLSTDVPHSSAVGRPRVRRLDSLRIQFQIVQDSDEVSRAIWRSLRWMPAGSFFWLSMLLIVFGIVSLFFYGSDVKSFLAYQVEPIQLVGVFALLLCVNVVHELAHAVTLSAQGGRPRSMGFMIIYFMPAFYCDVSLSWALSNRRARFWVAAAGPITQASMGGIFSIIGWRFDVPFLATTGLLAYLQAMVNCYPFLKFDGYVALVAYREKPFLMQSALTTLSARLRGRLFGTSVSNQDENDGRLLLFGLCAWISVATCVIFASWYVISLFASIPLISGSLLLFLLGWFGVVCTSWVRGGLREARRQSVSTFRQWAATLGIIAVFTTLLALPVTRSEGAMWWRGPNGGMYLSAAALGASGIELGDSYQLHSNGFAPIYCGDAKVTSIDQGEAPLDYSFMVPMDLSVESTVGVLNPTARSQECNGGVATRSGETVPLIVSVMQTIFGR